MVYIEIIRSFLGEKCVKCESREKLQIHHKIPKFLGGTNHFTNVTLLCQPCHIELHKQLNSQKMEKI